MAAPHRALILVDVQQEYFDGMLKIQHPPRDESLAAVVSAIDAATTAGIPVVVVQHSSGDDAPVFNPTSDGFALHPEIERRRDGEWKHITKHYSSVFADTGLERWLAENDVDTVTLAGFMTNNCVLATAAHAEQLDVTVEVLSDATGAIDLSNEAGSADAKTVHTTLMALLHSNWAAVATTSVWAEALRDGGALERGNLVASAAEGAARVSARG